MLLMKFISISGIMLLGWFVVLRSTHEIKNILLTKKERIVLFLFTIFIYIIFLFKATNKRAHGYAPMDFPLIPMLVVTFIIIGVLILVFKNLKMNGRAVECVSYSPKSIRWSLFFFWYFWHFSVTAILLLFHIKLQPLSRLMLVLVGFLSAATGALLFLWSVFYLTKKLILRKQ